MGNNCNTCVFVNVLKGDRPHVIIDPGHIRNETGEECFKSLERAMASDNIKTEDIGLIINTHTHPDHCEANERIVEQSKAGITLSREEDEFRKTVDVNLYKLFGIKAPQFTPLFHLQEGALDLGKDGFQVQVILTPGHSPGSVCLYLPEKKILITGDVIFFMSIGRTDFPGGDMLQLKNSIDKLSGLDVEYIVPGHNTEPNGIIRGKDRVKRNFEAIQMFF
ncbi:MAG: MBL fold metallo-hydrolase [Dehalococcoidia bacterium]|nr:MBL fold metallo-hydrolase [Dehalococcoidia bacterium]MDD5494452.1 MBL fold metallo-hydrolase [Dehalococcoidia bacterium]